MEIFVTILIPVVLCFWLLRLCATPVRWFWRIGLNSLCGFLCLWLLNLISGFTGIFLPINLVTAAIAGFLGLPGIMFLVFAQMIL